MKALVLTYDKYRLVTDHMIARYDAIWPDHPFVFRIPYQATKGLKDSRREYVEAPSGILDTLKALLNDIPDDEWVYWCIDDKYPVWLDTEYLERIVDRLEHFDSSVSAILFCRCRQMLTGEALRSERTADEIGRLLRRRTYSQIWIHQFVRVKVLKRLFSRFPEDLPNAKVMDEIIKQLDVPEDQKLYVTYKNYATFGESTSRGKLTANCHESFIQYKMPAPDIAVDPDEIYMGAYQGLPLIVRLKSKLLQLRRKLKQLRKSLSN